jgi:hypothetical protein
MIKHLKEISKLILIMPPSSDRGLVDWLANLGEAGCVNGALRQVEFQAHRVPFAAAGVEESPRNPFEVGHRILVLNFENRGREDLSPVAHQTIVLLKSGSDVSKVVRPPYGTKVAHPA